MEQEKKQPIHKAASMDLSFVVIGFDGDQSKVTTTTRSIKKWYANAKIIVVVPDEFKQNYKEAKAGGKAEVGDAEARGRLRAGNGAAVHPLHLM